MSVKNKILLASNNKGKIKEISTLLQAQPLQLLSLRDVGEDESFQETGSSFAENAKAKAMHYHRIHGLPTIADDSGLVIDALNGEPGILSNRYLGQDVSHERKMADILLRMREIPTEKRQANFCCALALVKNKQVFCCIVKRVFGRIANEPQGEGGFGYDPIFYIPELNCTLAQADESEKNKISHRAKAIEALVHLFETHAPLRKELGLIL